MAEQSHEAGTSCRADKKRIHHMRKDALGGLMAVSFSLLWLSATPARLGAG